MIHFNILKLPIANPYFSRVYDLPKAMLDFFYMKSVADPHRHRPNFLHFHTVSRNCLPNNRLALASLGNLGSATAFSV